MEQGNLIQQSMMGFYLIILSLFDMKEKRIPLILLGFGFVWVICYRLSGTLACVIQGADFEEILQPLVNNHFAEEMLFGCIPGILLIAVSWASKAVGCGDGLLLIILGLEMGYQKSMLVFGVSLLGITFFSILLLLFKKVSRNTAMPFVPFLCGGYCLCCFVIG